MRRIHGVDALRGLLAVGVMLYHFMSWSNAEIYETYPEIFEMMAVSFVEIFFIISGFSLFYVYQGRLQTLQGVKKFYVRRFFRIAPLFYFLLALVIAIKVTLMITGQDVNRPINLYLLFMNLTFLYGLVWPADSLVISGWSVGVEMAIYLFFPILLLYSKRTYFLIVAFIISMIATLVYTKIFLNVEVGLEQQWGEYVFFINHLPFFIMGFIVFYVFKRYENTKLTKAMFFLTVLILGGAFLLLFSNGLEEVLMGDYRYVLMFLCFCCVLLFAIYEVKNEFLIHLGELSYSIYLGHFFVFLVVDRIFDDMLLVLTVGVLGTYFFARFTYKFIEQPMINIGRKYG